MKLLKIWQVEGKVGVLPESVDLNAWSGDLEIAPNLGVVNLPAVNIAGNLRSGAGTDLRIESLTAEGDIRIGGKLTLANPLAANGNVILGGALDLPKGNNRIAGNLEARSIWADGNLKVGGNILSVGSIRITGILAAHGNITTKTGGIEAWKLLIGGDLAAQAGGPMRAIVNIGDEIQIQGDARVGAVILAAAAMIRGDAVAGHGFNVRTQFKVGGSIISPEGGISAGSIDAGYDIQLGQGFNVLADVTAGWGLRATTQIRLGGRLSAGREISVQDDIIAAGGVSAGLFLEAVNLSCGGPIMVGLAAETPEDKEIRATILQTDKAQPKPLKQKLSQKEMAQKAMTLKSLSSRGSGKLQRTA